MSSNSEAPSQINSTENSFIIFFYFALGTLTLLKCQFSETGSCFAAHKRAEDSDQYSYVCTEENSSFCHELRMPFALERVRSVLFARQFQGNLKNNFWRSWGLVGTAPYFYFAVSLTKNVSSRRVLVCNTMLQEIEFHFFSKTQLNFL